MSLPKKILVADDDLGILEVVKIILEESGRYAVETISDGDKVEAAIRREQPNLVLLDIWMPGCDGRELTKKLKADATVKDTPILLVSAYNDIETKAKEVGADGFVEKPFDIEDLKAKVANYLH